MSATPYYRAYCKHCDCTVKTDDTTRTWMDDFFLPERCPGCHGHHSRHGYGRGLYNVEFGFWKFVPADPQPPKRWWWPFGLFGERVWTIWEEQKP